MPGEPFYVLGLRPGCGPMDVEREGQKLLAMLDLGLASAATYASPSGEKTRDVDTVRAAMAELRDPCRRLVHELWAASAPDEAFAAVSAARDDTPDDPRGPWPDAFRAGGWRR